MWYAIGYVVMGGMAVVAAIDGGFLPGELLDYLNRVYTTPNMLLALGIIGICSRLDKLIEAHKKASEEGV